MSAFERASYRIVWMSAMISGQMSAGQTSYVSPQNRLVSEAPEQSERGSRFERYQRAGTPPAGRHLRNARFHRVSGAAPM